MRHSVQVCGCGTYIWQRDEIVICLEKMKKQTVSQTANAALYIFRLLVRLIFQSESEKGQEECIRILITAYESETGCSLDISELCLCARLVVCRKTGCGIGIVISGTDCLGRDVCIDEYYKIGCGDPLYGQFKKYFMAQLEKELFGD